MNQKSSRVDVEVGNSSTDNFDDLNDAQVTDYKQLSYKLFQYRTYKLRGSDGEFGCPFCDDYKDEHECKYTHLLLHAIRVAESEESGKHRANHFGMARFLAIDLGEEVKAEADRLSWSEDGKRLKRPRPDEDSTERGVDLADKVRQLEEVLNERTEELNEMTDELNDLFTRERQSNNELHGVRRELIQGLNDILKGNHVHIGIKNMGEIDPKVFISEMEKRLPPIDAEMKGVELCSLWQEKIKNSQWYPYQIIVDDNGKPKRTLKEDDTSLQGLKKQWGQEIHDAVVGALSDLYDYNPSGCYVVPELWNFKENRKAKLDEVISYILEAVKDVSKLGTTSEINNSIIKEHGKIGRCLGNHSDGIASISDSDVYEYKGRIYELLKLSIPYKVRGPSGELRCPFCSNEENREYNYLLRHALAVGESSSESAKQRAKHFALAKYLVIDLQHNVAQSTASSPASSSGGDQEIGEGVQSEAQLNDATINDEFPVVNDLKKLSRQMISQYFCMPIAQAAKQLNIGLTCLKRRCRELGIPRWPYRKRRSLQIRNKDVQAEANKNVQVETNSESELELECESESDDEGDLPLSRKYARKK
ncbi:factor of DNA methylation 5-like isoform X2 [Salvia miltiorrhiza]|uniref:factor of DNA methylation 5-like isoform X2 n=1 Tax=Salvia miltiorrhiza TaxID=226208 RepID=UPI0025AC71C6|nr:factor of DNA methylation 5-like isoform X2 [Salvia miltiorrhiza]